MKIKKHTIPPFYNQDSKVLILGSFPSIKSREEGFYYAHPKNRFWPMLAQIYNEEITDKKKFLSTHKIALFDVCASCNIKASSDASIRNVIPNDISHILKASSIELIILNGKTASKLFYKHMKNIKIKAITLPSTSPANAAFKIETLINEYKIMKEFTK